jgi:ankyrin repeat protein
MGELSDAKAGSPDAAALLRHAARGSAEGVRMCLSAGVAVGACRPDGMTALHYAARSGAVNVVRLLLEHGAEPNAKSISGYTPLVCAAAAGRGPAVQLLLASGADPSLKVHGPSGDGVADGLTALDLARLYGHEEVTAILDGRDDAR